MTLRHSRTGIGLSIAIILLLSVSKASADKTCYCRTSTGERVEVGTVACLKTNNGPKEARCGFVLNNTAWKFTGKSCPLAGREGEQDPSTSETVLAEILSSR